VNALRRSAESIEGANPLNDAVQSDPEGLKIRNVWVLNVVDKVLNTPNTVDLIEVEAGIERSKMAEVIKQIRRKAILAHHTFLERAFEFCIVGKRAG
jgi:3-dehydroquinate dehydratase